MLRKRNTEKRRVGSSYLIEFHIPISNVSNDTTSEQNDTQNNNDDANSDDTTNNDDTANNENNNDDTTNNENNNDDTANNNIDPVEQSVIDIINNFYEDQTGDLLPMDPLLPTSYYYDSSGRVVNEARFVSDVVKSILTAVDPFLPQAQYPDANV